MNLRAIANAACSAVNPNIPAMLTRSSGSTDSDDFRRIPAYEPPAPVTVQIQALSKKEIEHLDTMNLSGNMRAVYGNVQFSAVDRPTQRGGDLLSFTDPEVGGSSTWLVVAILEAWGMDGWCKAAIVKQND